MKNPLNCCPHGDDGDIPQSTTLFALQGCVYRIVPKILIGVITTSALLLGLHVSQAQTTNTWTGSNSTNWSRKQNWVGNTTITSGQVLVFSGTQNTTNNNDNTIANTYDGIVFNSTAGAFSLNGNAITLAGDIIPEFALGAAKLGKGRGEGVGF